MRAPLPALQPWDGRSQRLIRKGCDRFVTPAERDGLETTPTFEETCAFLESLAEASPLIAIHDFGTSAEGRALKGSVPAECGIVR